MSYYLITHFYFFYKTVLHPSCFFLPFIFKISTKNFFKKFRQKKVFKISTEKVFEQKACALKGNKSTKKIISKKKKGKANKRHFTKNFYEKISRLLTYGLVFCNKWKCFLFYINIGNNNIFAKRHCKTAFINFRFSKTWFIWNMF